MSGGCKVLLILGAVFGVLILLCCGGVFSVGWYFARSMSDEPQDVRAVTERMVDIEVPAGYKPATSIDFKVPFSGKRVFAWATYVDKKNHSALVLASIGEAIPEQQRQNVELEIKRSLREEGIDFGRQQEDWETWERQIEVRGRKATFTFASGKDAEKDTRLLSAVGQFQGKQAPVIFMFIGEAEHCDEGQIVKIIESIR
jgi:hypothetical protein